MRRVQLQMQIAISLIQAACVTGFVSNPFTYVEASLLRKHRAPAEFKLFGDSPPAVRSSARTLSQGMLLSEPPLAQTPTSEQSPTLPQAVNRGTTHARRLASRGRHMRTQLSQYLQSDRGKRHMKVAAATSAVAASWVAVYLYCVIQMMRGMFGAPQLAYS